jgi:hypothetical protein
LLDTLFEIAAAGCGDVSRAIQKHRICR